MAKLLSSTHSWIQNRNRWILILAAVLVYGSPLFVFNGFGAFDAFLKIEGIKGESTDEKHKDEIHIESFSWGMSQSSASGGGGGAGKVSVHDISIMKSVDKSSPKLMLQCFTGDEIPDDAWVSYSKTTPRGPVDYLKIKLSDILVTSYKFGPGGGSDAMPVDSLSLNFTKIEMTYMQLDVDGNLVDTVTAACDFTPVPQ